MDSLHLNVKHLASVCPSVACSQCTLFPLSFFPKISGLFAKVHLAVIRNIVFCVITEKRAVSAYYPVVKAIGPTSHVVLHT